MILKDIITACSYISLNFNFVNSKLSINILKALIPILNNLIILDSQQNTANTPMTSGQQIRQTISSIGGNSDSKVPASAEEYLEQRLQSQITTPIDRRSEKDNVIFALSNLLKGHPENATYFIRCDASKLIMHEVLRQKDSQEGMTREIIELTLSCIK